MEYRNATWNMSGGIDMEINHPELGWVPFTARSDDPEPHGRDLFAAARGVAVEYAAPTADEIRARTYVTKSAFLAATEAAGILTKAQRLSAARGEWPASVAGALDGMSDDDATNVQIAWAECTHVARTNPVVLLLAEYLDLSATSVDALFGLAGLE